MILLFLLPASIGFAQQQITNVGNFKIAAGAQVAFYGDIVNHGSIIDSGKAVILAGNVPQIIGGDSAITFYNLTLNNTSETGITLAKQMHTRGELTFTRGILHTSSTSRLILDDQATVSGASNSSFVAGPMLKTGQQAFTFPVGKDSIYAPLTIGTPVLATDQFLCEYFYDDPNGLYDRSSKESTLTSISACEYWILNRENGASEVPVTISWDEQSCNFSDLSELRVARWNGSQWKDHGNGGTTGVTSSGTVTSSSPITSFSPFTVSSSGEALPIELLSFDVKCKEGMDVIEWVTSVEVNNDFFTVEKSRDGFNWEVLVNIEGAGYSSDQHQYAVSNTNPYSSITYYQLKQTDFNGSYEYAGMVSSANCTNGSSEISMEAYPNPSTGKVHFSFENIKEKISHLEVFDAAGRVVIQKTGHQSSIDLSSYSNGFYLLKVKIGDNHLTKKLVLEK